MTLKNLDIKLQYRTDDSNKIITEFYIPVLSNATEYYRAVGYFSSTLLISVSRGISKMIGKKGKIKIVTSPNLSIEDIEAIKKGYNEKKIIEEAMIREFSNVEIVADKMRLNYLSQLIANGDLEIKVAVVKNNLNGIYHEKIGIVIDENNDKIAFTGSLNETFAAYSCNFESIDVFCSWNGGNDLKRIEKKMVDFHNLWENKTDKIDVYDCPEAIKNKILEYRNTEIVKEEDLYYYNTEDKQEIYSLPEWLELRDYQEEAIRSWIDNDGIGYFNMATGTGKTLTALSAIDYLIKYKNEKKVFVVIVCPYMHLVDQWSDDLEQFYTNYIKVFSTTKWEKTLKKKVNRYNLGVLDLVVVVITNSSFMTSRFQKQMDCIEGDILIIVDEVHNAGTNRFSSYLDERYKYRLGLSATPERYFDEHGTSNIQNFFQKEVFKYDLEKAIIEGHLTEYFYYPEFVYLTDSEYEKYIILTKQAVKYMKEKNGKMILTEKAKRIYIKRSRLIAGMEDKLVKLKTLFIDNNSSYYNLIYCGATYVEDEKSEEELRQIIAVSKMLGNELDMKVKKFTADESLAERNQIIKEFSDGISLQAIVAIKCLDEGVNIPSIKNAYILSSSSNPKEFVQRRGRVLRKYKGKDYSNIYDFIVLPRKLDAVHKANEKELK